MRGTDLRIALMAVTAIAFLLFGFLNAWLLRWDYGVVAKVFQAEIRQVYRAGELLPGRRIVLAGGSNVMFGLDAELIARYTGIPAVNAGMPNMLGSERNYVDFLMPMVRPGDLVIYSSSNWMVPPTPHQRRMAALDSGRVASSLSGMGHVRYREREGSDWPLWTLFPQRPLLAYLLRPGRNLQPTPRDGLGNALPCALNRQLRTPLPQPHGNPPDGMFNGTRDLAKRLRERGARLIVAEAWTLIRADHLDRWLEYRRELLRELGTIAPVLPADAGEVLRTDAAIYCDNPLHLLKQGSKLRTEHLLRAIRSRPELLSGTSGD